MKIQIELTEMQERHLIQLGLASLTAQTLDANPAAINLKMPAVRGRRGPYKTKRPPLTAEQRARISETMTARWSERRAPKTAAKTNGKTPKWDTPEYRRAYGRKWRLKRKQAKQAKQAKQTNGLVGSHWTPAHREAYAKTLIAKGHTLNKLKSAVKGKKSPAAARTNGKALDATVTTRQTNGALLRHDGKPYKEPGKRWSAEHTRNFVRSYKKTLARKRREAAAKAQARVKHEPPAAEQATTVAAAAPLKTGHARHKTSRPNSRWTDEQRARFRETMAAKRAAGWVPARTRGAQK